MTEADLHNAVADFLAVALPPEVVWTTVEHGYSTSRIRGARLKRKGVRAGWPDIQLVWQDLTGNWVNPIFAAIELKSPRGRLSAAQKAVHADLRRAGVRHLAVCRSVEEVSEALQEWGIELRARV